MSNVWEIVSLSEGDEVTIRIPHYRLTFANTRCYSPGEDDITILLDKTSSKIKLGPRTTCATET